MENKGWGDASEGQGRLDRRADLVGFLWDVDLNKVVGPQPEQHDQGGAQLRLGEGQGPVPGLASMLSPSLWTCLPFGSRHQ